MLKPAQVVPRKQVEQDEPEARLVPLETGQDRRRRYVLASTFPRRLPLPKPKLTNNAMQSVTLPTTGAPSSAVRSGSGMRRRRRCVLPSTSSQFLPILLPEDVDTALLLALQYYLHYFCPEQPDLKWENEEVRQVRRLFSSPPGLALILDYSKRPSTATPSSSGSTAASTASALTP